nr:hypothetical protein GCM10020241_66570 [Streptoalloteichus tenebrarius]
MVAAGLVVLLATGCGMEPRMPIERNKHVENELWDMRGTGRTVPLKEMIPGDWDSVRVFSGPISRRLVEKQVGTPVNMDDAFMDEANLLLLMKNGAVVRMVSIGFHALLDGHYSSSVQVVTRTTEPNRLAIRLVEPHTDSSASASTLAPSPAAAPTTP